MSLYSPRNIPPATDRLSDEDEPSYEECEEEAMRRFAAERVPANAAEVAYRAMRIFTGEEQ